LPLVEAACDIEGQVQGFEKRQGIVVCQLPHNYSILASGSFFSTYQEWPNGSPAQRREVAAGTQRGSNVARQRADVGTRADGALHVQGILINYLQLEAVDRDLARLEFCGFAGPGDLVAAATIDLHVRKKRGHLQDFPLKLPFSTY
jgi:hypothetical protein